MSEKNILDVQHQILDFVEPMTIEATINMLADLERWIKSVKEGMQREEVKNECAEPINWLP